MPNIIFTGDPNFPIIFWQMETADGGTHENRVHASKCLSAICTGTMLTTIYRGANEKNNILDVFLSNNYQLTQIINETSMSDHNMIQIETNIKIVEEKQNHQIAKRNLSYRDLNFYNEVISCQVLIQTYSTQAGTCF